MRPAAPALKSVMMVWPKVLETRSLKARAIRSLRPPAGHGTRKRMGRLGRSFANADPADTAAAAAPDITITDRRETFTSLSSKTASSFTSIFRADPPPHCDWGGASVLRGGGVMRGDCTMTPPSAQTQTPPHLNGEAVSAPDGWGGGRDGRRGRRCAESRRTGRRRWSGHRRLA